MMITVPKHCAEQVSGFNPRPFLSAATPVALGRDKGALRELIWGQWVRVGGLCRRTTRSN